MLGENFEVFKKNRITRMGRVFVGATAGKSPWNGHNYRGRHRTIADLGRMRHRGPIHVGVILCPCLTEYSEREKRAAYSHYYERLTFGFGFPSRYAQVRLDSGSFSYEICQTFVSGGTLFDERASCCVQSREEQKY